MDKTWSKNVFCLRNVIFYHLAVSLASLLLFFSHLHYNTVRFNGYNAITAICKRKQIEWLSVVCWQMLWFHKSEVRRYGLLCRLLGNKFLIDTYLQWSQNNNKAGVKKSNKFKSVQMKGFFSWNLCNVTQYTVYFLFPRPNLRKITFFCSCDDMKNIKIYELLET